jgi:hypothetical protein
VSGVLHALLDIDVHLLEAHLVAAWASLRAGNAHAPRECVRMACDMVLAFGDTRLLPQLLLRATEALCAERHAAADASTGELLCEPQLAAAWTRAAARLLPGQAPELLQCVRDCLALASRAGALDDGGAPILRGDVAALTELLAANVAGVSVTPEAAAELAAASVALQLHIGSLLQELPMSAKSLTPSLQAVAALLLRLCTVVAALVEACSACTSGLGVPASTVSQCTDVARSALSRFVPHLQGSGGRACTPWFQLEAARCAMLLANWQSRGAALDCAAVVAVLCPWMLAPETRTAMQLSDWDGVVSSVSDETLPCALWQLITEHMAAWRVRRGDAQCERRKRGLTHCAIRRCPCVSAAVLEGALAFLVQTAAGLVRSPHDDTGSTTDGVCITPYGCSRQLLGDASFYELAAVRAALPRVLLAELRAAQEQLTRAGSAASSQRVEKLMADIGAGALPDMLAAPQHSAKDSARMPCGGDVAAVTLAVSRLLRLVALVGWIPAPYFAPSELQQLVAQLLQLEQRVVCTMVTQVPDDYRLTCNTLRIMRTVVAGLLAAAAEPAPEWSSEPQVKWVLHSLHVLASAHAESADADSSLSCDFTAAAVKSGALLGQLLQCMLADRATGSDARAGERVLAAVTHFCSDMPALAVTCAAAVVPSYTKQPLTRLLPRTVAMQRHLSKTKVCGRCDNVRVCVVYGHS